MHICWQIPFTSVFDLSVCVRCLGWEVDPAVKMLLLNSQVVLKQHPVGMPKVSDFERRSFQFELADKNILFVVKVKCLSFEAAMRVWLTGKFTYMPGVQIGDLMFGMGVGEVLKATGFYAEKFATGDLVQGMLFWQDYLVVEDKPGKSVSTKIAGHISDQMRLFSGTPQNLTTAFMPKVEKEMNNGALATQLREKLEMRTFLSLFGIPTYTAYFGVFEVGLKQLRARGEKQGSGAPRKIALVSAAAGATRLEWYIK